MSFTFEEGSGFSAFALFNAIKLHFTSDSYDYFKYGGKTNVSKDAFANRKDKYTFYRLSRKYSLQELRDFYVSNFLVKDVNWVGDIANAEGEENYKLWQKRNQRLTYEFEQDIIRILEQADNPDELVTVPSGGYPALLQGAMQNSISIETLVILNSIMNFFPMWSKKISDDIIWPTYQRKCLRYEPFLQYDKEKFKTILKESIKELCQ
jgi:hypothetical protein